MPRAAEALMSVRSQLKLNADAQVRIVFYECDRVPVFECEPCETFMLWREGAGWWQCPRCEYELTPAEAEELVDLTIRRLVIIRKDVRRKRGGRWPHRVGRWFARILRRLFG